MTTKNPILEELHAIRERLLADAGGTLDALVNRLQAEEEQSDRPRFQPRRTTARVITAKPDEMTGGNPSLPPVER